MKMLLTILLELSILFFGCLTPKKVDKYVGLQFNNTIPKEVRKKNNDIVISSPLLSGTKEISSSVSKTSNMLPLLFYWKWDYSNTCTLNSAIAITDFSNTVLMQANKGLNQKLNGEKLELTVEQIPNVFAIVDKTHMVWLIYAFSWDKIFIQPDHKDLIVSYKVLQNGNTLKSGKIDIKNTEQNQNKRFFQSWKSATSEYLDQYNIDVANMSKKFVTNLIEEL